MTIRVAPLTPPLAASARTVLALGWPLLHLARKIIPGHADATPHRSPPVQQPFHREPATVDTIDRYTGGTPVWAYIAGKWLAATVAAANGGYAYVTYAAPGTADPMVEAVHPAYLQLRDQPPHRRRHSHTTPPSGASPPAGAGPALLRGLLPRRAEGRRIPPLPPTPNCAAMHVHHAAPDQYRTVAGGIA